MMEKYSEGIFREEFVLDLSFFNFKNAVTATFFCDPGLRILRVNNNFREIFPQVESFEGANLPYLLNTLGVDQETLVRITELLRLEGKMKIPELYVTNSEGKKMYSFLATKTNHGIFPFLNGVQGQIIDRTEEYRLRQKNEALIQKLEDSNGALDEKSRRLTSIAERLAKYLSPQVFENLFAKGGSESQKYNRKYVTVFFSDIEGFTRLSDRLEPEKLAELINSYLSDMAKIAIDFGGTIDKFVGDAVMVFFGDPTSAGINEDAIKCLKMASAMRKRVKILNDIWQKKHLIPEGLSVRMGIASGFCTVGDFGSSQKMDYTILGSPVNLAARLQGLCQSGEILLSAETHSALEEVIEGKKFGPTEIKGFPEPLPYFRLEKIVDSKPISEPFDRYEGENIDIWIKKPEEIEDVLAELKRVEKEFETRLTK